jgi:hypothetical protein
MDIALCNNQIIIIISYNIYFQILTGTLDSFMWESYPARLWNVVGSTHVPACAWNNARRGI